MTTAIPPTDARPRQTEPPTDTPATVRSLKRIRWAVRATLILGVVASVAANVLHAQPHPISQTIAAWPPVALLLTVELISRVPVHRKLLAAARLIATTAIAGIAAWVSYWHMAGVASRYGETGLSAYLLPISVDGLIVVASISLVELSARLQLAQPTPAATPPTPHTEKAEPPPAKQKAATALVNRPDNLTNSALAADIANGDPPPADPADHTPNDQPNPAGNPDTATHDPDSEQNSADADTDEPHHGNDSESPGDEARQRRRRGTTRRAVIDAYREDPTQHPTAIAETVGTSERTVRRYLDEFRTIPGKNSPNGTNGAQHTHNGNAR